ncbi:hypothetical protein COBT_002317 [Conglomerata obtusa]
MITMNNIDDKNNEMVSSEMNEQQAEFTEIETNSQKQIQQQSTYERIASAFKKMYNALKEGAMRVFRGIKKIFTRSKEEVVVEEEMLKSEENRGKLEQ